MPPKNKKKNLKATTVQPPIADSLTPSSPFPQQAMRVEPTPSDYEWTIPTGQSSPGYLRTDPESGGDLSADREDMPRRAPSPWTPSGSAPSVAVRTPSTPWVAPPLLPSPKPKPIPRPAPAPIRTPSMAVPEQPRPSLFNRLNSVINPVLTQVLDNGTEGLRAYTRRRGELLEILNGLHSTGIQNELDLPQIVVIGSQSVGKSSLIESMSGITLPRNSGTCTKCPMECHLQSSPTWSCKVVLRFQYDSRGNPLLEVHEYAFGSAIYDKTKVEKTIRRAQKAILNPSTSHSFFLNENSLDALDGHPDELSFSPNCVCIRVTGPSVPDLYFYDLPGIIANVKDGENESDIKAVEDIAKRYISRPNCLVLLVISCETDFENQGAGRLVLKDPALRNRTVGVLTKADRIEPGTSPKWLATLKNKENYLQNGWFAVKQPSHRELEAGISWELARANEDEFFTSTEPWASLETPFRRKLGSVGLAEHLSRILSELVSKQLPDIQRKVTSMLATVKVELDALPLPTHHDPRREILTLLRDFTKKVSKHIEGLAPSASKISSDSSLIHRVNAAYDAFRVEIHRTAPRFRPWEATYVGINQNQMITSAEEGNHRDGNGIVLYANEVLDLAKRSRTRELPGNFPFSVKDNLIREATNRWRDLAQDCFNEVERIFRAHLDQLLKHHFASYAHSGLMEEVGTILREQLHLRVQSTTEKIDALCHLEDQPFTQNEHYFFDHRAKFLDRFRGILRESKGQSVSSTMLNQYNPIGQHASGTMTSSTWSSINSAISYLAAAGIHVEGPDLAKLLPLDSMEPALEIMAEVRAYFQVAYKRFADVVPQQIDTDFLREFDTSLDIAVLSIDLSRENCAMWLSESPGVVWRRKELIGKMKRLELANEKLREYRP